MATYQVIADNTADGIDQQWHPWRLHISHTLSSWNARFFEFAVTLLILSIFPRTLLATGIFGLVTTVSAIILSPYLGSYIDRTNRLEVMQHTIFIQRSAVVLSCVAVPLFDFHTLTIACFIALLLGGVIERNCAIANTIAIERDWLVIIAQHTTWTLSTLNASMRRIDLSCALLSPIFASGCLTLLGPTGLTLLMIGGSIVSAVIEYSLIRKVYKAIPHLEQQSIQQQPASNTIEIYMTYFHSSVFLPSLSLSILYLTVLSFGAPMVAYLKTQGMSDITIAALRSSSVLTGLCATLIAPRVTGTIGLPRTGLWSLWSQLLCLIPVCLSFYGPSNTFTLFIFLSLSRIGLWAYDLTAQEFVQTETGEHERGQISGCEQSLKNVFDMGTWILVILFNRPERFYVLATISVCAVFLASCLYSFWVRQKRGHLLHIMEKIRACTTV